MCSRSFDGGVKQVSGRVELKNGQLRQTPGQAAIAVGDLQFVEQSSRAHVQHREATARGLVRQGARQRGGQLTGHHVVGTHLPAGQILIGMDQKAWATC